MEWIFMVIALVGGAVISIFYFGGLWLTLSKVTEYKLSYWLILLSFVLRLAFVLLVFYALLIYHWSYMAIAMVSFLLMRQLLLSRLGKPEEALYN